MTFERAKKKYERSKPDVLFCDIAIELRDLKIIRTNDYWIEFSKNTDCYVCDVILDYAIEVNG